MGGRGGDLTGETVKGRRRRSGGGIKDWSERDKDKDKDKEKEISTKKT